MTPLTILHATNGQYLTKAHTMRSGAVTTAPYGNARTFTAELRDVSNIRDLANVLTALSHDPFACVVRGIPRAGADLTRMNRKLARPTEQDPRIPDITPHPEGVCWIKLDIDDKPMPRSSGLIYQGDQISGVSDPVEVVRSIIRTYLPPYFQGVSVFYNFSASAGVKPWGEVRLGLWYSLDRPIPDGMLYGWAKRLGVDPAVFTSNQCNYIAAPIFRGMADPCEGWRCGLIPGERDELVIPDGDLRERVARYVPPVRSLPGEPINETGPLRRYALAELEGQAYKLRTAHEGGRNSQLNVSGYALGGYIPLRALRRDEIIDTLMSAAAACGLVKDDGQEKTKATLERAIDAGEAAPRHVSHAYLQRPQVAKVTIAQRRRNRWRKAWEGRG